MSDETIEASEDRRWRLARESFNSGDYAGAIYQLKALEKDGVEAAAVEIGNIYELGGNEIEKDFDKAKHWYKRAIGLIDDPVAYLCLARVYYAEKKYDLAHKYLLHIISENQPGVYYMLGHMYRYGRGVEKDLAKSMEYYQYAENEGHIIASFLLGLLIIKRGNIINGLKKMLKAVIETSRYSRNRSEYWRLQVGWKPD